MIGNIVLSKTGRLTVEFTNESAFVADLVRFRIPWGANDAAFIRDQGTFAPGITVKHEFKQSSGALISPLFSHENISCSVESVHFTNGTQWQRPTSPISTSAMSTKRTVRRGYQILGDGYIGALLETGDDNLIRVHLVLPGSPADKGGLKQADIIQTINGENLSQMDDAIGLITATSPNTILEFIVRRGDDSIPLRIKTGTRATGASPDGPV